MIYEMAASIKHLLAFYAVTANYTKHNLHGTYILIWQYKAKKVWKVPKTYMHTEKLNKTDVKGDLESHSI